MHCLYCAASIKDDSLICPECGKPTEISTEGDLASLLSSARAAPGSAASNVEAGAVQASALDQSPTPLRSESKNVPPILTAEPTPTEASPSVADNQLDGRSVHALLTQANLARLRSQWSEAIDCCVAVLRAQPGNQAAHSLLGDIYRGQGRLDDAIQWYRMAVDLHPSPTDEAKLAQVEREREQRQREDAQRRRQGYGSSGAPDPLATDADLNAGTTNLIGLSPRRWLHVIWITSFAFLVIVIVALIRMTRPAPLLKSGYATGSSLPPQNSSPRLTASASPNPAGTGLRPDQPAGNPMLPAPQTNATSTGRASTVPPASVLGVRPLNNSAVVHAPRDSASPRTGQTAMPLTGDMHIAQVQNAGNGMVVVQVEAPQQYANDTGASARETILRNIYRAARSALSQSSAYTQATIALQTQMPGGEDAAILEATLDRNTAMAANPETDSPDTLEERLQSLRWLGQNGQNTPEQSTPNDAPQNDSSG